MSRRTIYFPHNTLLFAVLSIVLLSVVGLVLVGVISVAFRDVGLSPAMTAIILFATFLGGFINIPLLKLETTMPIIKEEFVSFFGMIFRIPQLEYGERTTVVAINVGGALIPAFVASYLFWKLPSAVLWV
jgi:uncharacterized membrane protein